MFRKQIPSEFLYLSMKHKEEENIDDILENQQEYYSPELVGNE